MAEAIIELKNVSIFQGQNLVLEDVNLTVNKGEFVYLIGKTGTGKSSLLKTLYGDLPLRTGEGMVAGFDLKEMNWKKVPFLRRNLGVVFQDFQLLTDRSVNDNLKFVLKATGWKEEKLIAEKIADVLDKVGLKGGPSISANVLASFVFCPATPGWNDQMIEGLSFKKAAAGFGSQR